jgi:hypothetical protein
MLLTSSHIFLRLNRCVRKTVMATSHIIFAFPSVCPHETAWRLHDGFLWNFVVGKFFFRF